ncbi:MAG: hypothetical protein DYG92_08425 [Leptolyngbya sp. PLA1]|nr:hypothetical protein [Leptolyngbya sp. PLA1]
MQSQHEQGGGAARVVVNTAMLLTFVAASVVGCGYYLAAHRGAHTGPSAFRSRSTSDATAELAGALGMSGLDARALATAQVAPAAVAGVVQDVRSHLDGANFAAIADARHETRAALERLEASIQSGSATEQDKQSLAAARAAAAGAEAAFQTTVDAVFEAGVAGLSPTQRTSLARIRANREYRVAVRYLRAERSEAGWVALREATAAVAIAANHGANASQNAVALTGEADEGSTAAASGLSLLPQVRAAWNAEVSLP